MPPLALINFSALFVALAVALPVLAHQFRLVGPTFLPMHLFVLTAGLLLGWRAGVAVGLLTPLISYAVSGMPPAVILPQIIIEVMCYGLAAGILRQKLGLNVYVSLIGAMAIGRIGLLLAIWIIGNSPSNPWSSAWQSISVGWPGILIQLALVPIIVTWAKKIFRRRLGDQSSVE